MREGGGKEGVDCDTVVLLSLLDSQRTHDVFRFVML